MDLSVHACRIRERKSSKNTGSHRRCDPVFHHMEPACRFALSPRAQPVAVSPGFGKIGGVSRHETPALVGEIEPDAHARVGEPAGRQRIVARAAVGVLLTQLKFGVRAVGQIEQVGAALARTAKVPGDLRAA